MQARCTHRTAAREIVTLSSLVGVSYDQAATAQWSSSLPLCPSERASEDMVCSRPSSPSWAPTLHLLDVASLCITQRVCSAQTGVGVRGGLQRGAASKASNECVCAGG